MFSFDTDGAPYLSVVTGLTKASSQLPGLTASHEQLSSKESGEQHLLFHRSAATTMNETSLLGKIYSQLLFFQTVTWRIKTTLLAGVEPQVNFLAQKAL